MNREPWPEKYIEQKVPSEINIKDVAVVLNSATDERPLQEYLANVPVFLRKLLPSATDYWCFDRPSFGGELIPDFLMCYRNSRGFNWVYVELESPNKPPLTKAGKPAAKLVEGLSQISDWRNWLRENISYAQNHLGLQQIDAEALGILIIGRRSHLDSKHAKRYRSLSNNNTIVMTYDRLLEET